MSNNKDLPEYWLDDWQMPLLPTTSLVIPMVELLPPNPFEKPGDPIVIDLLEYNEKDEVEDDISNDDTIILAKAVQEIEDNAPAFGSEVFKEGHQSSIKITHKSESLPLHLAARRGDLHEISKLIKSGVDVNTEDHNSSTALHVAALCGKTAAAKLLLQYGANIRDLSYEGLSIVQVAIERGHYDTAAALIVEGKLDPNQMNANDVSPLNMLFNSFIKTVKSPEFAAGEQKAMNGIQKLLTALETFAEHSGKFCHYLESFTGENQAGIQAKYFYNHPISMQLKIYAALAPNQDIRSKILQTADKIYATDKSEDSFISAKNLLNVFPTGNAYHVKVGNGKTIIVNANGHFKLFTTELAKNSLTAYIQQLQLEKADATKRVVFERIKEVYDNAYEFLSKVGEKATSENYFSLYEQGKTILIPSGWDGHFVTLFASLPQKIVGVGNSGERYSGTQSGITFYKTTDKLDPQFIHEIAFNQNKQHFEHDKMYQYGIMEKLGSIAMEDQKYGNCTWESHRDAIEGMILVELLNLDPATKNSISIAQQYFTEWDHFHGHYQLEEYQHGEPYLPVKAFIDIFSEINQKAHGQPLPEHEQQLAKKVVEILVSTDYQSEMSNWLIHRSHTQTGILIKGLLAEYGLDVTESSIHSTKISEQHVNDAIAHFKIVNSGEKGIETQSIQVDQVLSDENAYNNYAVSPSLSAQLPVIESICTEIF